MQVIHTLSFSFKFIQINVAKILDLSTHRESNLWKLAMFIHQFKFCAANIRALTCQRWQETILLAG